MAYIAAHVAIPVPRVYRAFLHNNQAYIVMERTRGWEIPMAWKQLSLRSRDKIVCQLAEIVQHFCELVPPPYTGIQSCIGISLRNPHLPRSLPRFGPFPTTQSFHHWLREETDISLLQNASYKETQQGVEEIRDIEDMIVKQDVSKPTSVFTHGHLNPFNIIVRGSDIVGFVDWECSGWYPCHWKHISARHGNCTRTEWRNHLAAILGPFPEELKMEAVR